MPVPNLQVVVQDHVSAAQNGHVPLEDAFH